MRRQGEPLLCCVILEAFIFPLRCSKRLKALPLIGKTAIQGDAGFKTKQNTSLLFTLTLIHWFVFFADLMIVCCILLSVFLNFHVVFKYSSFYLRLDHMVNEI